MNAWLVWEPTPLAAWATFIFVVVAALSLRQYLRASAPAPLTFRLVALALLTVGVWQPSLRYVEPTGVRRPLRVIVDDSLSMKQTDATRSPGEWLRVAGALGTYDESMQPSPLHDLNELRVALDDLRNAVDKLTAARQADPIAAAERQRVADTRSAAIRATQVLHDSAEGVGCQPQTLAALDRIEQVVGEATDGGDVDRLLAEVGPDLRRQSRLDDDETAVDNRVAAETVARTRRMTRFELAKTAAARLRSLHPAGITLSGLNGAVPAAAENAESPLTAALRDACVKAAAERAEGVVLISDGRATETRSLLASAAAVGVPAYTVAVAPDDRSPDVRVIRIEARPAVLAGQSVLVRTRLAQRNAVGQTVKLTLTDGQRSVERSVQVGSDNTVELLWPDVQAPGVRLTARIEGVTGESQTANNSQSTYVAAIDRRERVLLLAGPAGRDVGDLAAAMGAVPWIDLKRPRFGKDEAVPIERPADELMAADVIVLADLSPVSLTDAGWAALSRAVRIGGRSLLVLAGNGDWLADPEIARRLSPLLPTTPGPRPAWASQPVWTVPTRFGSETSFLRLDETGDASLRAWLGRPKLSRVLAVGPPTPDARALLVDRSTQMPVLLDAAVGGGRVMWLLTDEAWRWTDADPDAARRFWTGIADALDDLPYAAEHDGLAIAIDRVDVTAGRTIYARVRLADPAAGAASIAVTSGGTSYGPPPLRQILPGGSRLIAPLNLPAGTFDLTVRQGAHSVQTTLKVAADAQQELADTTPDVGLLRRIADATGGAELPLEDIGRLPELLVRQRESQVRYDTYALWSSPYWFAAVVACFGMEWALRPRARLA